MDRPSDSLTHSASRYSTRTRARPMLGAGDIKINTTRFSPQPHKFDK